MQAQLTRDDLTPEDRFHFHFALGKALEDARRVRGVVRALRSRQSSAARGRRLRRRVEHRAGAALEGAVHAGVLRCARRAGRERARSDLHRRLAALGLDAARTDPVESSAGRRHAGAAGHHRHRARAGRRGRRAARRRRIRTCSPTLDADALRALGERYLRADAHLAQDRCAVLHRQDAEQLRAHRADSSDPAAREDHRCAASSARLLLLGLQAALRARSALHLRPRRHRPLLPRLRRADGALRRRAAGPGASRDLRTHGRRHRRRGAPPARLLRPAVRRALPALLRERARRAHRQLGAGAPPDLSRGRRSLA